MNIYKLFVTWSKKIESRKYYILAAVLLKVFLEFSYIYFVSPVFSYLGLVLDFSWVKYVESWVLYILILAFSSAKMVKPSDFLINFLNFSFVAPLLVYYSLSNAERIHLYLVYLCLALIFIFKRGAPLKIPFFNRGEEYVFVIIGVGAIVVSVWMAYSGGLRYFNLDLTRVYDFRGDAGDVINAGMMGYLNTWATKVFGPVLMAVALWRSKFLMAALVFVLHLYWFGVSSHKSVLFFPFLILFLWAWFRNTRALALIPLAMSAVIIFSTAAYLFWDNIFLGSMLVRRVFFVPAQLTFVYYEFFSLYDFVYWSNSFLSMVTDYPYETTTALLIGSYMGTDSAANNSFIATGYMHAGVYGVISYGILVGLLFRLIDSLARDGIPPWVAIACVIVPSQSLLINADLPTALLTHGIGAALLILFLMRRPSKAKSPQHLNSFNQIPYAVQDISSHIRPPSR